MSEEVETEHLAILRCQTWNVWPGPGTLSSREFDLCCSDGSRIKSSLSIVIYPPRVEPHKRSYRENENGHLIASGEVPELIRLGEFILIAPEDRVTLTLPFRHGYDGEVDLCLKFKHTGPVGGSLQEELRLAVNAVRAVLNIVAGDFLAQTAPFAIVSRAPDGSGSRVEARALVACHKRATLSVDDLRRLLQPAAEVLVDLPGNERIRTALELYASHFTEPQQRVKFLLLVMALEVLTRKTKKSAAIQLLLDRWRGEIESEILANTGNSEICADLEALGRELVFRREDSLRNQIRKLFVDLPGVGGDESRSLQARALRTYDRRSRLVHDGQLPDEELRESERDARELLELLIKATLGVPA